MTRVIQPSSATLSITYLDFDYYHSCTSADKTGAIDTMEGQDLGAAMAPGRCAMRGNCGRTSMFGADLPCPDDGPADKVGLG
jgi:hypothetical protein